MGDGAGRGLGPILDRPSAFRTTGEFWVVFVPSLTAMVGFWATLALNIPDLSRYARDQRAQIWGQFLGLPTTMTLFAFIGVAVTSASDVIFGEPIWDPVQLLSRIENPVVVLIALFALLIATLTTNVAANVVAPANGFANLWPSRISFAVGGVMTGVIGIAIMPWKLLENADRYMGWLVTYSAFLGPIAGVFIADYWIVRKARLGLADLYTRDGIYGTWNPRAIAALIAGAGLAIIGLFVPSLRWLYDYAWFVGFGVAFAVYVVLMRETPLVEIDDIPSSDGTSRFPPQTPGHSGSDPNWRANGPDHPVSGNRSCRPTVSTRSPALGSGGLADDMPVTPPVDAREPPDHWGLTLIGWCGAARRGFRLRGWSARHVGRLDSTSPPCA